MPAIRLLFLWHMHQPYYKDLVSGEYRLPWVRLHALKDYFGMVKVLDEFPEVHQTFNLVPSLIVQLQDYVSGAAQDPFLEMAASPAADLTLAQRQFALQHLFHANLENMVGRYPRYRELWEKFQGLSGQPGKAAPLLTNQDFTDLQVLSQIAWFDEYFLIDADVRELVRKQRDYTLEDQELVVAREKDLLGRVLPTYMQAQQRGAIEISASPFYHPILPLICDTNAGAASHSGLPLPRQPFRHPEDARSQITRALDLHQRVFGVRPAGMWPSEGSVSNEVLALAHGAGVRWLATDEGVLGRSLGHLMERDGAGHLNAESAERLYRFYRWEQGDSQVHVIFRDHSLSDLIGFVYAGLPAEQAAADFIGRIKASAAPLLEKGMDAVVPVILDGENAWESYRGSGREFLRRLYDGIQRDPALHAMTVSEALRRESAPEKLGSIFPGSWINANFDVWIGALEDNLAWDYLSAARDFFAENADRAPAGGKELAWEELLIAEGSDWNWWYGPEHHSANDRDFDELFRKHLSNVYHALGAEPPDVLAQPIIGSYAKSSFTPQTAYISPRVESANPSYFDWLGAATHIADRHSSAMHGRLFLLDTGYAGIDAQNLYCRLDFMERVSDWNMADVRVVMTVEAGSEPNPAKSNLHRLEALIRPEGIERLSFTENGHPPGPVDTLRAALRRESIFECRVPLELLNASMGTTLRIRFSLWRDQLPLDALPREGSIELRVVPENELGELAYVRP